MNWFKYLLCVRCWRHEGEEEDTIPYLRILGFSEPEGALREHPTWTLLKRETETQMGKLRLTHPVVAVAF